MHEFNDKLTKKNIVSRWCDIKGKNTVTQHEPMIYFSMSGIQADWVLIADYIYWYKTVYNYIKSVLENADSILSSWLIVDATNRGQ